VIPRRPPRDAHVEEDGRLAAVTPSPTPAAYPAEVVCSTCRWRQVLDDERLGGLVVWKPSRADPPLPPALVRNLTNPVPEQRRRPVPADRNPWAFRASFRRTLRNIRREEAQGNKPATTYPWAEVRRAERCIRERLPKPVSPEHGKQALYQAATFLSAEETAVLHLVRQGIDMNSDVRRKVERMVARQIAAEILHAVPASGQQ
jgi:hypothetical protein